MPGGPVYEDSLVFVGHALIPEDADHVYLGWLLVEPKRHLNGLADLRADEAERIGRLQSVAARALMTIQDGEVEHVYSFVLGHHVPHLHVHLLPRYRGTPREFWGTRVDEWPEAPTGDRDTITHLAAGLRAAIAQVL